MNDHNTPAREGYAITFWRGCRRYTEGCRDWFTANLGASPLAEAALPWGATPAPRHFRLGTARSEALSHERLAEDEGRVFRIFTHSKDEWFEDSRDLNGARRAALDTMRETPQTEVV